MAALVLSVAGSAAGGALFGSAGAIAGRLIGAVAGNVIDQALFGGRKVALTSISAKASSTSAGRARGAPSTSVPPSAKVGAM